MVYAEAKAKERAAAEIMKKAVEKKKKLDPADEKTLKEMGSFVKTKKKELSKSKKETLSSILEDSKRPIKDRVKAMNEHIEEHF